MWRDVTGYAGYARGRMVTARRLALALWVRTAVAARGRWRGADEWGAAEYAEYVLIVALVTVALAVGLHLLQPFASNTVDNVMDSIANSL